MRRITSNLGKADLGTNCDDGASWTIDEFTNGPIVGLIIARVLEIMVIILTESEGIPMLEKLWRGLHLCITNVRGRR